MLLQRPRIRTATAIKAIFVAQLAMAGWLVAHDFAAALPRLFLPGTAAPALDRPVSPGDQTRRYAPDRLPGFAPPPGVEMPAYDDMPPRLQFRALAGDLAVLTGDIALGDAARFGDWLDGLEAPPARLLLHSPGGSVDDALGIGTRLRAEGMITEVAAGDVCLSACPYILAGGVLRFAAPEAVVGVHQHYFGENTALPAFLAVRDIQEGQARVVTYLAEMGIDLRVIGHALATPPESIYVLTPQELERYRLVSAQGAP